MVDFDGWRVVSIAWCGGGHGVALHGEVLHGEVLHGEVLHGMVVLHGIAWYGGQPESGIK